MAPHLTDQDGVFEQVFELALDGVLLSRPDGTILRANPAACRALGRTEEEVCRDGRAGIVVDEPQVPELVARRAALLAAAGELTLRRPDGSTFPVEFTSALVPTTGEPLAYTLFRDITERRRMEDGLRRTNRALRLLTSCNEAVVRATTEAELFAEVCRAMVEVGGYRLCWVGVPEADERKTVRPVAHAGHDDGYLATVDVVWADAPRGRGPTGTAVRTGRPVVARDFARDADLQPWKAGALQRGYRSSSALPLMHEGERLGVITVYSVDLDTFHDVEVGLLSRLCANIAYGLQSLRQQAASVRVAREREVTELALRKSESLLKGITEAIPEPIFLKDREGRWSFANPATLAMVGKPLDEVLGRTDVEVFAANPGVGETLLAVDRRVMESGVAEVIEETLPVGEGHRVYLSTKAPFRDPDGRIIGLVGSARDITERKRTETALLESEERFASAFHDSPVAMMITSATTGKCVEVNEVCLRGAGLTRDEMIGHTVGELGLFQDPDARGRLLTLVHQEGFANLVEARLRVKSGEVRDALISSRGITLRGEPHLLSTIIDVTDRRRTEADRDRLITAIEQAAEMVMVTDVRGAIQYANPAFEALAGYSRAEVIGQNPRILKSGAQDDAFYRTLWETIASGKTWRGRLLNRRKDGSLFTDETTISPVRDRTGAITSYVAVKRDITGDLALEEQLRQSQKLEGIGRLAGGVAHDFNNLLAVILSYASMASEGLRSDDPLREDLDEIERAGKRAAALTRQLLAFSRKQVLQPVALDLNQTVSEMDRMLRRIIGEDIELVLLLAPDLGVVRADPSQLEQVLMNLVVNARDAMPTGGTLRIRTDNVELDAEHAAQNDGAVPGPHVRLAVIDTGIGMDEHTRARVFEPFFTTKPVGRGTGLGLSTVHGIVRQSGGSIGVHSEPGKGTRFEIYLPREPALTPRAAQPRPTLTPFAGTETILVVEDEPNLRKVTTRILSTAGYTVLTADSGAEALRASEQWAGSVDLLITDVVMPQMGGRPLADRLAHPRPRMKVLYMSGYTDDAILHHGALDPGTHFLAKPFVPGDLLRKVREVLEAGPAQSLGTPTEA